MIYINHVTLVGRLTKDIEIRKTQSNTSVCSFTVAVDRRFSQNGEKQADFISCIAWNQSADFLGNYAAKGTIVSVEGHIQTRSYDSPGGKVYVTEVVAESVQIISNRNPQQASPMQNNAEQQRSTQNNAEQQRSVYYQQTLTGDGRDALGYIDNSNPMINPDGLPFY